jgi:protein O-GlcNAc transferase
MTIPEALQLALRRHRTGRLADAEALYRQILAVQPNHADALHLLGVIAHQTGHHELAVEWLRRAIVVSPNNPSAHYNLGIALRERGQFDEAVAAYRHALELQPDYAEAYNNLGNVLREQGQIDEAITAFRHSLQLQAGHARAHSNWVYALHFHPGYDARAIAEECARWEQQHAAPLRASVRPHGNNRDPTRRLRIGYVSSNFFGQAECCFVIPLFEAHNHSLFEIHAYSDVRRPDAITERLKKSANVWHDAQALSDEQLAEEIREDRIDVLVDLSMHMGLNRMRVFARQPAPVQVAWLAYPGSTGLHSIGYRLTDAQMEPSGIESAWSAEEPVRLPDCWCCYHPVGESPEIGKLPALSAEGVTFGSLNSFAKVNEGVLARWARVLDAVEGSRLLMLCPEGQARKRVRAFFGALGIAGERVELTGVLPRPDYLRLYQRIDIGLDPFPYNGITTTCDALWMGVPVLTLPVAMPASRAGLSLLSSIGLGELAARSEEDYVRMAVALAGNLPRLASLRATLRPRMLASPLMDAPRFARNVEAAYRAIWERWCATTD